MAALAAGMLTGAASAGGAQAAVANESAGRCPTDAVAAGATATIEVAASVTNATIEGRNATATVLFVNNINPQACGPQRQRTLVRLSPLYDSKQKDGASPVITRAYTGLLQHLVYLPGNRWFMSGSARYLSNNTLALYLQQTYAVSIGTRRQFGPVVAELNVGPGYVGQNFSSDNPSTIYPAAVIRQQFSLALPFIADGAELTETASYVAPLRGGDPEVVDGVVALVLPINQRLSVTFSGTGDYVSNTPEEFKNSYFTTVVGMAIKLGQLP